MCARRGIQRVADSIRLATHLLTRPIMRHLTAFATAALLLATAAPLHAQQGRPIAIGLSGGVNLPQDEYSDGAATGAVASGYVGVGLGQRLSLRGELFWSRSDIDAPLVRDVDGATLPDGFTNVSGNVDLVGGIASLVLNLGVGSVQPYVIGGVGYYNRRVAQDIEGTIEDFERLRQDDRQIGYSGGVGLRFPLLVFSGYIEARYHHVQTEGSPTSFVPVTIGIVF